MSFLHNLPPEAKLLDVFRAYPVSAMPLLEFHEVLMRGPSPLTVAEREMLAAFVSATNACEYCHGVHEAVAQRFGTDPGLLEALVSDIESAPVEARLRPILRYLRKLTRDPVHITRDDATAIYDAGWNEHALHDAVAICGLFNLMNRFVQGLGIRGDASYALSAGQRLHDEGYAGLKPLVQSGAP